MSELAALEPFGDFHSALYFRDLFLRDETIYDEFFCPFCGVPLNQVLVYAPIDQELGKSPHFRTQPRGPKHYSGCDGNPSNYQHPSGKNLSKRTSKSADLHCQRNFLNILIARINLMDSSPSPTPTPDEILRRREAAGRRYSVARFRVSLVQSLAEAHLAVLAEAYQEENGWTDVVRQNWIRDVLQAPINLRGYSTTYRGALHDLWFPVPKFPRVFHGKNAKVNLTSNGYEIIAERLGKFDDQTPPRPFVIIFLYPMWMRINYAAPEKLCSTNSNEPSLKNHRFDGMPTGEQY